MNDFLLDLKHVVCASKPLSGTETHYANIERELLGLFLVLNILNTLCMVIILISLLITKLCYHYLSNLTTVM